MTDDLKLPQVPEPTAEDPEDVSWALSTAEAMWARGDHADGIKWVRRAAEAASEAENDSRALELAKAAADLMNLMARMTAESIDLEDAPASEPAALTTPQRPAPPPVKPASPSPSSVTKQVATPSRPPAPLPSRSSQSPPAPVAQKGKPLGTNTKPPPARPASAKADKTDRKDPPTLTGASSPSKKSGRKSRENLDAEARFAAGVVEVPVARERVIGNPDLSRDSAAEWDTAATQNLTGDEIAFAPPRAARDAKAAVVPVPAPAPAAPFDPRATLAVSTKPSSGARLAAPISSPPPSQSSPPATVVGGMLPHNLSAVAAGAGALTNSNPSTTPGSRGAAHDPGIITSQAVRVVVWRDGNGVHVAPAGTVVSAITVDAVLVALEPSADLTAWLSPRKG